VVIVLSLYLSYPFQCYCDDVGQQEGHPAGRKAALHIPKICFWETLSDLKYLQIIGPAKTGFKVDPSSFLEFFWVGSLLVKSKHALSAFTLLSGDSRVSGL